MILRIMSRRFESWAVIQARMIRETEVYLEEALRDPEQQIVIPAIPVGSGRFPRGYAHEFWARVLGTS
ncbi:MAG: hypothetical protein JSV03_00725 [Planctomycetota bacterium]|nr:MAG: hypothetical protein JSV03_00725 [Planctomycetota bacterium]